MAFIDYYKILGVDKNIPQADVRAAYRKRAKQFHPDLHPNDPKAKAKFQALSEAYDVIGDPEKRRKYDQYGQQWREAEAFGSGQGGGDFHFQQGGGEPFDGFNFSGFGDGGGFSSFFQELFGGSSSTRSRSSRRTTADKQAKVSIDLYTALLGGEVIVTLGTGQKVRLKINPGTQEGTQVRLRGKGNLCPDGTMTDLILTYHIKLPTSLNERQRQLLREVQQAG